MISQVVNCLTMKCTLLLQERKYQSKNGDKSTIKSNHTVPWGTDYQHQLQSRSPYYLSFSLGAKKVDFSREKWVFGTLSEADGCAAVEYMIFIHKVKTASWATAV